MKKRKYFIQKRMSQKQHQLVLEEMFIDMQNQRRIYKMIEK